jgi:acyl-CoA thioesterase-1
MYLSANQTILFIGDSITDASRDYNNPDSMGVGYASMASAWLDATYPQLNLKFYNRGINGNKTKDLRARWDEDCIALKPDWVSIMIGVNDSWRFVDHNDYVSPEEFEDNYRTILESAREKLDCRFILIEPFLLHIDGLNYEKWHNDLDPKIQIIRRLSREYQTLYVPFDGVFASVSGIRPPAFWAEDGVHPSNAGHMLMAKTWLNAVGAK